MAFEAFDFFTTFITDNESGGGVSPEYADSAEVASLDIDPVDAPSGAELSDPAAAMRYIDELERKIQSTIEAAERQSQFMKVNFGDVFPGGVAYDGVDELKALKDELENIRSIPRSEVKDVVTDAYSRAKELQERVAVAVLA